MHIGFEEDHWALWSSQSPPEERTSQGGPLPWAKHFLSSGQNPDTVLALPGSEDVQPGLPKAACPVWERLLLCSPSSPHLVPRRPHAARACAFTYVHTLAHAHRLRPACAQHARALAGPSRVSTCFSPPPCPGPRLCGFACSSALSPDPGVLSQDVETPGSQGDGTWPPGVMEVCFSSACCPRHSAPPCRSTKPRKWVPEGFLHSFQTP